MFPNLFCMWSSSFLSNIYWKWFHFIAYFQQFCKLIGDWTYMYMWLGLWFCSIDLRFCFSFSTVLFSLLCLYSRFLDLASLYLHILSLISFLTSTALSFSQKKRFTCFSHIFCVIFCFSFCTNMCVHVCVLQLINKYWKCTYILYIVDFLTHLT